MAGWCGKVMGSAPREVGAAEWQRCACNPSDLVDISVAIPLRETATRRQGPDVPMGLRRSAWRVGMVAVRDGYDAVRRHHRAKGEAMTSEEPGRLGRLDDAEEASEPSSTTEGAAARGQFDPAEGSPPGTHPTGEAYPQEATRYDDPPHRRPTDTD